MPRRRLLAAAMAVALLVSASCSGFQWFRPRRGVTGEAPDGTPAGEYDLAVAGARVGELRVWSLGGEPDGSGTRLHVGIELENVSDAPLELVPMFRLVDVEAGTVRGLDLEPVERIGGTTAGPDNRCVCEMWFRIDGCAPAEVRSFTLRSSVRAAGGATIEVETPFSQDLRTSYYRAMVARMVSFGGC